MTAALDHCVYRLVTPQCDSLKRSADELASADSSEAADAPASGLSVLEQLAANRLNLQTKHLSQLWTFL